jgi:UDP-2,3-diacylglucosamine hydrolase
MARQKIILFSDLHIDRWDWERTERFQEFLRFVELEAAEVFILGDIFDFPALRGENIWPKHRDLINAIRRLPKKGVNVTYIIGNHDVSLRGIEIEQKHFTMTYRDRRRPFLKTLFGQELYMEHGHDYDPLFQSSIYDAVDFLKAVTGKAVDVMTLDFLKDLKRLMQDRPSKKDAGLPLKHEEAEVGVPERFLKIWESAAEQILKRMRCNIVFFGHTHAPGITRMESKGQFYVNTGDWYTHSTFVEMTPKTLKLRDWLTDAQLDKIKF